MNLVLYRTLLSCLLSVTVLTAGAQQAASETASATLLSQIHSVEQADAILADIAAQSAKAEDDFVTRQRACYERFFVNNCLDEAKEKHRAALAELRPVEGAANHFKRAAAVEQRERDMAQREQKSNDAAAERATLPVKVAPSPIQAVVKTKSLAQRQAEYDAKVKRQAEQDAANAGKRAANSIQFEKKQCAAAQRQSDIAAKQAAKDAQSAKDASDKSK